ncbi:ATP-dependent nuclease [Aliivibrio fischeri]|uniref:ATP-dependent endonuclease n=1 Tax=Aliivibrio fischeri SR5 TaxID=1088719 RepID=A0AAV3ETA5_ALIFS|nr:ATP-dependent endonuclease [Aliivibrio fischeri]EHN70051.1 ATP-dependent endonuclease [Aliivibrio fischeri SR5]
MHLKALKIKNFRRLKNVTVELDKELSIFVGANNSGKTSTGHALQLFTSALKNKFSVHDFHIDCWDDRNIDGDIIEVSPPVISLDIWFEITENDLHKVIEILPNLQWEGSLVGVRIEFAPIDILALIVRYQEALSKANENIRRDSDDEITFHPKPRNLIEYIEANLHSEYELKYFVLDSSKFEKFNEIASYTPAKINSDKGKSGKDIINSLIKVDYLHAQRHLSDNVEGGRTEELSKRLSRFYDRNLDKIGDDYDALEALSTSEKRLNEHLDRVFSPTLSKLSQLGYPGLSNHRLLIKSSLNPAAVLSNNDGASVYYSPNGSEDRNGPILPDKYNGLGYKNLIYMVIELLDVHTQWLNIEDNRPPIHLIFIEEPEAHLHAQLQQVFIRKVLDILSIDESLLSLQTQLVVTTHSTHILYERGFMPIRYFKRDLLDNTTKVLNLSEFSDSFEEDERPTRDFLQKYLKLTHCDLFFADAAIFVEGNVERLLLPEMIENSNPSLKSCYLTILEIGGAYGHKFKPLIEFLGLTTLIITDIDSVTGNSDIEVEDEVEDDDSPSGQACMVETDNSITSNQMLIKWLPGLNTISELLQTNDDEKVSEDGLVRVAYQTAKEVTWGLETGSFTGRTLEVAFALDNLDWCQDNEQKSIKLRIPRNNEKSLEVLIEKIHNRVKGSKFDKTGFALELLMKENSEWNVPSYIKEGLDWLESKLEIVEVEV